MAIPRSDALTVDGFNVECCGTNETNVSKNGIWLSFGISIVNLITAFKLFTVDNSPSCVIVFDVHTMEISSIYRFRKIDPSYISNICESSSFM